jgi:hypothetical protein
LSNFEISNYLEESSKVNGRATCKACKISVRWSRDRVCGHKRINCINVSNEERRFFAKRKDEGLKAMELKFVFRLIKMTFYLVLDVTAYKKSRNKRYKQEKQEEDEDSDDQDWESVVQSNEYKELKIKGLKLDNELKQLMIEKTRLKTEKIQGEKERTQIEKEKFQMEKEKIRMEKEKLQLEINKLKDELM